MNCANSVLPTYMGSPRGTAPENLADTPLHVQVDTRLKVENIHVKSATSALRRAAQPDGSDSTYLAELVGHNSRRIRSGKDLRHVHDFMSYARTTRGHCEGALDDTLDQARQQELRDEILNALTATVLLHEIAQHVLDHVSAYGGNFIQQHMREVAADRWTINVAVNANCELRPAVPLFLFLAATGGGTLEDDIRTNHPSGLRRVRDLLVQTRALLDDKDPVGARMMDASIEDLDRRFLR